MPHALRLPLLIGLLILASGPVAAQQNLTTPRLSPAASVSQRVGLTDLVVDYHRPGVHGRAIWGALVPYGEVWRAGANENTVFTTSTPLTVQGQPLPAGRYGLHVIPSETGPWTVIFSTMADAWGSFSYDPAEDVLRVEVDPREVDHQERLAYRFDDPSNESVELVLHWERLELPVRIEVDTPAVVLANMERELRGLPRFFWQGWNQIAAYALQHGRRLDEALGWADRSIGSSRTFTNLNTKADLLTALGREAEAAPLREEAFGLATEAEVNAYGYQLLGRGDVDGAIAVFQRNVDAHPDAWNVYDSLAEAYVAKGETARAIELYERARSLAPETQHTRIDDLLRRLREQR